MTEQQLTTRQTQILAMLRESVKDKGYAPSVREIGKAVGLHSTSSVVSQLRGLEELGFIRRDSVSRGLTILDAPATSRSAATIDLLERAAAKVRATSAVATQGRWGVFGMTVLASTDGTSNADAAVEVAQGLTVDDAGRPRTFDVDHIAFWSPAVGTAVADWLEQHANAHSDHDCRYLYCEGVALARVLLGEDS